MATKYSSSKTEADKLYAFFRTYRIDQLQNVVINALNFDGFQCPKNFMDWMT